MCATLGARYPLARQLQDTAAPASGCCTPCAANCSRAWPMVQGPWLFLFSLLRFWLQFSRMTRFTAEKSGRCESSPPVLCWRSQSKPAKVCDSSARVRPQMCRCAPCWDGSHTNGCQGCVSSKQPQSARNRARGRDSPGRCPKRSQSRHGRRTGHGLPGHLRKLACAPCRLATGIVTCRAT